MKLSHIFQGTYALKLTIKHKLWKEYFAWLKVKWVYDLHCLSIAIIVNPVVILLGIFAFINVVLEKWSVKITSYKYKLCDTKVFVAKYDFRKALIAKGGKLRNTDE